jgi:hypothetical protein
MTGKFQRLARYVKLLAFMSTGMRNLKHPGNVVNVAKEPVATDLKRAQ